MNGMEAAEPEPRPFGPDGAGMGNGKREAASRSPQVPSPWGFQVWVSLY